MTKVPTRHPERNGAPPGTDLGMTTIPITAVVVRDRIRAEKIGDEIDAKGGDPGDAAASLPRGDGR